MGERDYCGTHMLNSGCWFSESESQWLEAEVNSAFSVTATHKIRSPAVEVGRSDGHDTPELDNECLVRGCDWIKDKRNHDKWTCEATGSIARHRKKPGQLEKNTVMSKQTTFNDLEEWLKEHRAEQ